jgi:hypothetical protein
MERYKRIRDVIGWMCLVQPMFLEAIDRFVSVHNAGMEPCRQETEFAMLQDAERQQSAQSSG